MRKKWHQSKMARRVLGREGKVMDWMRILAITVATVGLIQLSKNITLLDKSPKWVFAIGLIPVAIACSAVFFYLPPFIGAALLVVALGQLGYEVIIQAVKKLTGVG